MKVKFLENTDYSNTGLDVIKAKVGDIKEIQDAELAQKFCERKWCEPVGKEPEEIVISDVEAPAMKAEEQEEDDFLGLIDEKPAETKAEKKAQKKAEKAKKKEEHANKMRNAPENKGG